MKSVFVRQGSDEWHYMWRTFGPDFAERHLSSDEVWQYMGTWLKDGKWVHEFRHRMHPKTNNREYRNIPASVGFIPQNHRSY